MYIESAFAVISNNMRARMSQRRKLDGVMRRQRISIHYKYACGRSEVDAMVTHISNTGFASKAGPPLAC